MWRNLLMVTMVGLLVMTAANKLAAPPVLPVDDRPRAPDYVAGWLLPVEPAQPAAPVTAAPAPSPQLAVPTPREITGQLDQLWARQDWDGVIALLEEQRRASAPVFGPAVLREKLYAAEVNAGRSVLRAGNVELARQHFLRAQAVDPIRPEAPDALRTAEQPAAR